VSSGLRTRCSHIESFLVSHGAFSHSEMPPCDGALSWRSVNASIGVKISRWVVGPRVAFSSRDLGVLSNHSILSRFTDPSGCGAKKAPIGSAG
jgi:hypothetical protein